MFVVCRNKNDNSLFITTRMARETMLRTFSLLGERPDSNVIKDCKTYDEANKFKNEQERVDKELNNLLNKNQ
jgi:hypothetical protein